MPEVDGRQLIAFVRAEPKLKDLPVVIVSGVVGPHQIASLLQDGASRFLPKPIDANDIKGYVSKLMK